MHCKANGCFLPVNFITHWHDLEKGEKSPRPRWGVCFYHRAAHPHDWKEVTRRINLYKKELDLINAVKSIDHIMLKPVVGEKYCNWIARCEAYFNVVIIPNTDGADGAHYFNEIYKIIKNGAE